MKTIVMMMARIILSGICAHIMMYTESDARGEIPPPPPFQGGGAGDWLGSGPIFGFEPSVGDPWMGGGRGNNGGNTGGGRGSGYGSTGGKSGGGRKPGAWGGAWWTLDGPLGGGGWGGWGGWGSGIGAGSGSGESGEVEIDTLTGHIWPEGDPYRFTPCFRETWVGPGANGCACLIFYDARNSDIGSPVFGVCEPNQWPVDLNGACGFIGVQCQGATP